MVTDDRKKIISSNLRRTVFGQEGLQVQTLQWERHMAADLKGVHHLVPETLQVNAQNLDTTYEGEIYTVTETHSKALHLLKVH